MPDDPLHPELEALEREWAEERKLHMIRGRYGNRSIPRTWRGCALMLGCAFFVIIAVFFSVLPGKMSELHRYAYGSIAAVVALVYVGLIRLEFSKKKKYEAAEEAYQQRRALVEKRLGTGQ